MKSVLLILLLSISTLYASPSQTETEKENTSHYCIPIPRSDDIPGEKEKTYCSPFAKTKYKLLITKDKIRITRLYKEYKDVFRGIIKKGKIYSNDPNEKSFKPVWGKYYKLEKNNFGILNIENGDYEWFSECKE
jgi:hypothetical protein